MRWRFQPGVGIAMGFSYLGSQKVLEGFEAPQAARRWGPIVVMLAIGGIAIWFLSPPGKRDD